MLIIWGIIPLDTIRIPKVCYTTYFLQISDLINTDIVLFRVKFKPHTFAAVKTKLVKRLKLCVELLHF